MGSRRPGSGAPPFRTAKVGNEIVELIAGEHPHSRSDNKHYARFADGRIEGFDGHSVVTRVDLREYNYLKQSGLSGDEVRKGGTGKIYFDDVLCYEFFFRDIQHALTQAGSLIPKLHEVNWSDRAQRNKLKGRKVYYRDQPAIVESLIVDQGCVILIPEATSGFRPPAWDQDRETDHVKCEVIDPHIWWWRD
jgi:hypothetical protein